MDERWLLDPVTPAPTAAEVLAFGNRTVRRGSCVLWTGTPGGTGYGQATFRGAKIAAHRLAFALTHGGLPRAPWQVAHRCDEKLCVTPRHLLVSTLDENLDDHWRLREDGSGRLQPLSRHRDGTRRLVRRG